MSSVSLPHPPAPPAISKGSRAKRQTTFSDCATGKPRQYCLQGSLRKQPTFNTGFPAKWHLRNERRNSILMTRHYPDLGSASDWSCHEGNLIQPIRSPPQIWVVTRHQYGISALVSQMSLAEKPVVALPNVTSFFRLFKRLKTVALSL